MPDRFARSLRPVPILNAQDAIDLTGAADWNIKEVLIHIVDDIKPPVVSWHLAYLLEQSMYGEGPFESEEE